MKFYLLYLSCMFMVSVAMGESAQISVCNLAEQIAIANRHVVYAELNKKAEKILNSEKTDAKNREQAVEITNAYAEAVYLERLSPSQSLPALFALLENEKLTDFQLAVSDGLRTNSFGDVVYEYIRCKMGINGEPAAGLTVTQWLPESTTMCYDRDYSYFMFYCGLKHVSVLWEDWYACWKKENCRKEPRAEILSRLAREYVAMLGYHAYPYLYNALKSGDTTLAKLVSILPLDGGTRDMSLYLTNDKLCSKASSADLSNSGQKFQQFSPKDDTEEFIKWWNENSNDYIVCQSKSPLEEQKHVFTRKNRILFFGPTLFKSMLAAEEALKNYCANHKQPGTNCWYYSLPED